MYLILLIYFLYVFEVFDQSKHKDKLKQSVFWEITAQFKLLRKNFGMKNFFAVVQGHCG